MCNGVAQCARLCRMRVACTRRVSTATRFLCASKRWHATVSYRGGAGKINFADEGRKGTRKKGTGYQREGCQAGQDGCGATMGQNRWKRGRKGLALPVRLLVQRTVRRIAIQTFSAHFFVPPAGELFLVFVFFCFFLDCGEVAGGLNYSSRATADKSANPQTWLLGRKMLCVENKKKKNMYIHTHVRFQRELAREKIYLSDSRMLFVHDHVQMSLSKNIHRSLLIKNIDPAATGKRQISCYFI